MLWWLIETTVVAGALALVAGLLARLRPLGIGPAARHALWLVVLVKLITPPLVQSPWAFAVPASVTSAAEPSETMTESPEVVDLVLDPIEPTPFETRIAGRLRLQFSDRVSERPMRVERELLAPLADGSRIARAHANGAEPVVAPASWLSFSWPPLDDPAWARLGRALLGLWLAASLAMAAIQALRIARFARRLGDGWNPPDWILDEVDDLAEQLGVRAPRALVVPGIGVPMLWCLGRPTLLLPAHLVKTMGVDRWRGVIAHELAHLRRGDPWVGRLALLVGIVWWWNPIYHLARRRIDAEAELACDAWVVSVLPGDRVVYAGTMLEICEALCHKAAPPLAPALGGGGAGRLFERRLTMILNDRVPCRLTWHGLIAPGLLVIAGLPTWTATGAIVLDDPPKETKKEATIVVRPIKPGAEARAETRTETIVIRKDGEKDAHGHQTIILSPGGQANVNGKVFVVTPDGKANVDGKLITGKAVIDGKTIVVTPVEGEKKQIRILVSEDGKPVELKEGQTIELRAGDGKAVELLKAGQAVELRAKAQAARAEAMKHVEAMRARSRAQVDAARAAVDKAAEALKRAKAEEREAEKANNEKAEDAAEAAVNKATSALEAAITQLKSAEEAAKRANQVRVEVHTQVRTDGEGKAHAEAKVEGKRLIERRVEVREHVGPDGKKRLEIKEFPAADAKAKAEADEHGKAHRFEVKIAPHGDAKPGEKKELEVQIRDLTQLFGPGSEFIKGLETLGPELEKGLREALGPGTEFDVRMKELGTKLGKELKENLGPGSDFDKAMKELAKTLEKQFGPGSEFEKHVKEFAGELEGRVKVEKEQADPATKPEVREERPAPRRPAAEAARERYQERTKERNRDREIQALEARIKELTRELERVKKGDKD
ncbi:MAG: M56 family metallopeptidase [Isosphaeraceae bacterium]